MVKFLCMTWREPFEFALVKKTKTPFSVKTFRILTALSRPFELLGRISILPLACREEISCIGFVLLESRCARQGKVQFRAIPAVGCLM